MKSLSPTCRLSRGTSVLLARYSALATIIIFSLGTWCHKFDLVISFTDRTRATKREENDGEDASLTREEREKGRHSACWKTSTKIRDAARATGTPLDAENVTLAQRGLLKRGVRARARAR